MLLVYDGTTEAQAALERCTQLSLALSAHVDVVAVVDLATANAKCGGLLSDLAFKGLEEFARRTLDTAVGQLADRGVPAYGFVKFGRPVDVVSGHVTTFGPEIVVIGHRRRKGLSRWWGERPVHLDLAERLRGTTIVTVVASQA
jgi:nucleotide-binding universal stress UspA family protein